LLGFFRGIGTPRKTLRRKPSSGPSSISVVSKEGDFSRWLLRIAKNVCIDEWRRRRPETAIEGLELTDHPAEKSFDSAFETRQMVERLWQEIRSLPASSASAWS